MFLIDSDIHNNPISNSVHVQGLFNTLKSKHFNINKILFNYDNIDNLLQLANNENNILFIVHSFKKWKDKLETLANNTNASLVVYPTDLSQNEEDNKVFNHENIDKIIIGTDFYHKHFMKNLKIPNNKLKLLYASSPDSYKMGEMHKNKGRILVTPSLISPNKDFLTLLKAIRKMRYNKYINN